MLPGGGLGRPNKAGAGAQRGVERIWARAARRAWRKALQKQTPSNLADEENRSSGEPGRRGREIFQPG